MASLHERHTPRAACPVLDNPNLTLSPGFSKLPACRRRPHGAALSFSGSARSAKADAANAAKAPPRRRLMGVHDVTSALLPTYARYPLAFERGEGTWLTSTTGEKYLDFGSGIAVTSLGHAHPHLVQALTEQAQKLWLTSNLFQIPEAEALAQRLRNVSSFRGPGVLLNWRGIGGADDQDGAQVEHGQWPA